MLSEDECIRISRPFNKLFKHLMRLTTFFPTDIIQYKQATNVFNLFHRNITAHCDRLAAHLTNPELSMFSHILNHRIYLLQSSLHLPFSPLLLTSFSAFLKTKQFRLDLIFRTLYFASNLGIQFASPSMQAVHTKEIPIYKFFHNAPQLYASSLPLLKKLNIIKLSDCCEPDGISFSLYKQIAIRNGACG